MKPLRSVYCLLLQVFSNYYQLLPLIAINDLLPHLTRKLARLAWGPWQDWRAEYFWVRPCSTGCSAHIEKSLITVLRSTKVKNLTRIPWASESDSEGHWQQWQAATALAYNLKRDSGSKTAAVHAPSVPLQVPDSEAPWPGLVGMWWLGPMAAAGPGSVFGSLSPSSVVHKHCINYKQFKIIHVKASVPF